MENIVRRKPKNSVVASLCEHRCFLKPTNKWAENQKEPNTNLVNERNGKRRANAQLKTWLEQNNSRHQQTFLVLQTVANRSNPAKEVGRKQKPAYKRRKQQHKSVKPNKKVKGNKKEGWTKIKEIKKIKYKGNKIFLHINQNGQKHKNQIQTWKKKNEITVPELDIEEVKQY